MGAAGVGGLGGLLGASSVITQLFMYQVLGQVLGALLQPYLTEAQYDVNSANPLVELTPAILADCVVRTIITEPEAATIAKKYGMTADVFHQLVLDTGEPPALEMVLQWWRRGLLPWDGGGPGTAGVLQALQTSRIRPEWYDTIPTVQYMPITAADAVNAYVRNQIDEATYQTLMNDNAYKPDMATILYNTVGRPPSPTELAHLVRIGFIPLHGAGPTALSLQQGILEGDLKDKWEPAFEALINVYPGLFEILQMAKDGGLPDAEAAKLYAITGLPAEYIPYMVAAGDSAGMVKTKNLTEAMTVKLYADGIITEAQTSSMLQTIGYSADEAAMLLSQQDMQAEMKALDSAVSRTRSLFLARKVSATSAQTLLTGFGVPAQQAQNTIAIWVQEQAADVKTLTAAEILDAWKWGIIDQPDAQVYLEALGYSPFDAWVKISIKGEAAQPNKPLEGENVQGAAQ